MPHRFRVSHLPGQQETESKKDKRRRYNAQTEMVRRHETAARPGQKPNENFMRHESFTLPINRLSRRGRLPSYSRNITPERPPVPPGKTKRAGTLPPRAKMTPSERESERFMRSPQFHQTLRGSTPEKPAKLPKPSKPPKVPKVSAGNRNPVPRNESTRRSQEAMRERRERESAQRAQGQRIHVPLFPQIGGRRMPDEESERYMRSPEFERRLDGPLGPLNDAGH